MGQCLPLAAGCDMALNLRCTGGVTPVDPTSMA